MDDKPFFEPTLVLSFVRQVQDGRLTVLRSPVAQGNSYKWLFFVNASGFGGNRLGEGQFDRCLIHYACDVAKDGRFDLRGGTRYTCANESHEQVTKRNRPSLTADFRSSTWTMQRDYRGTMEM